MGQKTSQTDYSHPSKKKKYTLVKEEGINIPAIVEEEGINILA